MAVRGKLVPQNPEDEPAELLRNQIVIEKQKLEKSKKLAKQRPLTPVQEDEQPYSLPDNWCWCRWNDIALHIGDIDHKMPTEVSEGIPYVSPRDFKKDNVIDFERAKKIAVEDFERLRKKVQPTKWDIIFPRYGTIGENRLVEVDIDFLASYSCATIKNFHGYVEPKYSYYYSLSKLVKSEIDRYINKTTQPNVGLQSIQNFIYPLPPLAEQKRIVAKVDELMALCDRLHLANQTQENLRQKLRKSAIAALMSAETDEKLEQGWAIVRDNWCELSQDPKDVDDLRRSVLQLAVRGKLLPQDFTDESVLDLLVRVTDEKKTLIEAKKIRDALTLPIEDGDLPYEIPNTWAWKRFGNLILDIEAGASPQCEKRPKNKSEWGVIKISAVSWNRFNPSENKALPASIEPRKESEIKANDFIMSRANTSELVGKSVVVEHTPPQLLLNDKTLRVLFPDCLEKRFFNLCNNSDLARQYYGGEGTGTSDSMKNITREQIRNLPIPLPPLAEQKRIVTKVDELMQMCDRLEESLRQSQQRAETFVKSAIAHLKI
ncbi:MAG: restriction endonuclease subunit S [Timaviella obliquedivisa GSE-PSE-MK23-08B]|nr:restriction endonuclease subunit S [Timaviella obliquedivisa GSE-PSE-MK23-08B]